MTTPPRLSRLWWFTGPVLALLVGAVVIVSVALGQLDYNTWTAMAGSTIWCKFFLDFALSRQAHGAAARAKPKVKA